MLIPGNQKKVKSLSRARLFATSWAVACTRLLCPWDFLGKSTGVGCHFFRQEIFLTQGSNPGLPHCRQMLYHLEPPGVIREMQIKATTYLILLSNWQKLKKKKLHNTLSRQEREEMSTVVC